MGWLQSLIYGFVSGFTEFTPVSAPAHEAIMRRIFGVERLSLQQLFIHLGVLSALLFACKPQLERIHRERSLMKVPPRRRRRQPDVRSLADYKLMKSVTVLLLLSLLLYPETSQLGRNLGLTAALLIINGFLLFLPQHLPSGNKDARSLSRLDGVLIGLSGALSVLPGISRMGAVSSTAIARGTDRQYAIQLSLLVSLPVLTVLLVFDVIGIATAGLTGISFLLVLQSLLSALMAWAGATCAITMVRFLAVKAGLSGFAYYSWGAALFSFILFLMT